MRLFELNSIWHDRFGDYRIVENDGTDIIAEYVSGDRLGEMKLFGKPDKELILRIHANVEYELNEVKKANAGKVSRESVENLVALFKRAPKEKTIVGRDNDSIFCAILMEKAFNSKIVGMFDATTLRINQGCDLKDCFFLDIEIFNKNYHSIGNHLNCVHPACFDKFFMKKTKNCINANIFNGISGKNMANKYPFGTNLLLLYMIEKIGILPSELGIDKSWLLNSIAQSDGSANSIFNARYIDNTYHWATEFFGDSETANSFLLPIYRFDAWTKKKADTAFDIGGKTKTHVKKTTMNKLTDLHEFQKHVRYIYHCMNLEFDITNWPLFDIFDSNWWEIPEENKKCVFYNFESKVTEDITKMRNIKLYSENSKMVTSCIRSGENMDYTEDINNVFEE